MAATVGLDIGTTAVRVAAVDRGRNRPILRRFGEIPLPEGAVNAGEVVDEAAVAEAISALWKRHKLHKKRVVIGTANQRVIVRQVDVPQMSETELVEALPFQVQDSIPMPVEEALLDFVPIEEFTTPDGEPMLSILVVAAHQEMVDGLLRITEAAGITPMAVDLGPFALVRAVFGGTDPIDEIGPQSIVDIGASLTQIVLVRGGTPRFVRLLPRGGADFTESLADGLGIEREEAELQKRRVGVAPEGAAEGDDEDAAARRILTRQADAFIEEIRNSINYHLSQTGDEALSRLIVAGNGARLPHLANRLAKALGTTVHPAKILELVDVGRVQMAEGDLDAVQPVLPPAVGLALWGVV